MDHAHRFDTLGNIGGLLLQCLGGRLPDQQDHAIHADHADVALFTGIEFMFNENASVLMGTSIYPFNTNVGITGDPLPNLDGTDTTDATTSTVSDTDFDMNLDITVTFRY